MTAHAHLHLRQDQIYPFDARGIAKRFRHAAIFGALDALTPGERMGGPPTGRPGPHRIRPPEA